MHTTIDKESQASKIAGIFNNEDRAQNAVDAFIRNDDFQTNQMKLIPPYDSQFDEKVEPEDKNIGKTLLRTHLAYGIAGLIVGILISSTLLVLDFAFMQSYVVETYTAVSVICIFIAMLAAGFVTVRPDHDHLINETRKATQSGKWVLIVHLNGNDKVDEAKHLLKPFAESTAVTL
ncbi:MAG: hypothetical protein ACTH7Q_13595 [Pseudoalteromonas sp.]